MSIVSSGGMISSRVFIVQDMKRALRDMPSSQSRKVRKLARNLDEKTQIGYYAALDVVATIGTHILTSSYSTVLS